MISEVIWLVLYTVIEFINFFLAYKVILNAEFTERKWLIPATLVLVCMVQTGVMIFIDNTWKDVINAAAGAVIPLLWIKGRQLHPLLYYPVIVLGTSVINSCASYFLAVVFGVSEAEVIKSPSLSLASMCCAIILMIIYHIWKTYRKKEAVSLKFTNKQYCSMFIGLFCCGVIIACTQWIIKDGYIPDTARNICGLAISLVSVIFVFISIWLGVAIERENDYRRRNMEYEHYLNLQEEHIKMLIDKDNQLRKFRHDIHAHITALMSYAVSSGSEELIHYIREMENNSYIYSVKKYMGHSAVDAVINELFDKAEKSGILIDWNGKIEFEQSVSIYDMCTIFSNLISNAIEACIRIPAECERKIIVRVVNYEEKIYLMIKNSCMAEQVNKDYEQLMSTKGDDRNHGLGTKNVLNTVLKYGGTIKSICEDNWFEVQILL